MNPSRADGNWWPTRGELLQVLVLGLVALCAAAVLHVVHPRPPSWAAQVQPGEIDLRDVQALVAHGAVLWVDARRDGDYAEGHIPDAILCNEDDWDAGLMRVLEAWRPETAIVVYCDAERCDRAAAVAERLRAETGFEPVHVLQGGWQAWQQR